MLSIDGFGDMVSAMWGVGEGHHLKIGGEVTFPHSLGVFYTAVTQYLGFPKYGDEYKVMGLASYGEPEHLDVFRRIVRSDGLGYELGLDYFRHHVEGAAMTWDGGSPELPPLWGPAMERDLGPARGDGPLEPHHENVAASLQRRLEEVVLGMLRQLHERTGIDDLCLAGGVALNCVVNGKIFDETPFRRVYIQPAAYDGGTSVGAAYHVWHQVLGRPRGFVMDHAYWGPEFGDARLKQALEDAGVAYAELPEPELLSRTADALADGKVVGWYQGRMEFGPRALGNRSILTDPRRAEMKDVLNARIKHREPFRPFAPSRARGGDRRLLHEGPAIAVHADDLSGAPRQGRRDPRAHPRRRDRPAADGPAGPEPAVLRAHRGVRRTDRRAGPAEHVVQRERADLLHPRGGRRDVPADEDGCPRPR